MITTKVNEKIFSAEEARPFINQDLEAGDCDSCDGGCDACCSGTSGGGTCDSGGFGVEGKQ